jgi:hypothetical protein
MTAAANDFKTIAAQMSNWKALVKNAQNGVEAAAL